MDGWIFKRSLEGVEYVTGWDYSRMPLGPDDPDPPEGKDYLYDRYQCRNVREDRFYQTERAAKEALLDFTRAWIESKERAIVRRKRLVARLEAEFLEPTIAPDGPGLAPALAG